MGHRMNTNIANFDAHETAPRTTAQHAVATREQTNLMLRFHVAQAFPRDERASHGMVKAEFSRTALAEQAHYEFAKGGSDVRGLTIRAAETLKRCWGHMDAGYRVVDQTVGIDGVTTSHVEAFAEDYSNGNYHHATILVKHWRVTKKGGYKLSDEREISMLIGAQASKVVRNCILACLPADFKELASDTATSTIKAKADTSPEGIAKMVEAFDPYGVTREMIEVRIQRSLDAMSPMQMISLKRIWVSLRDGMSTPDDWFTPPAQPVATEALDKVKKVLRDKTVVEGTDTVEMLRLIAGMADLSGYDILADEIEALPQGHADKALLLQALSDKREALTTGESS
jgi:hypothetical protein